MSSTGPLTLALIKPHVLLERNVGQIITEIENAGFAILLCKMLQLRKEGAEELYAEHKEEEFFPNLIRTMTSGPIWVMTLAKDDGVEAWRTFMGVTDPAKAAEGTLRRKFGDHDNLTNNAVHGSATDHDARREIGFFFGREISLAEKIDAIDNGREIS